MPLGIMQNRQIRIRSEMTPHSYRLRPGFLASLYPGTYRQRPGYLVSPYPSILSPEAMLLGALHFYQPRPVCW